MQRKRLMDQNKNDQNFNKNKCYNICIDNNPEDFFMNKINVLKLLVAIMLLSFTNFSHAVKLVFMLENYAYSNPAECQIEMYNGKYRLYLNALPGQGIGTGTMNVSPDPTAATPMTIRCRYFGTDFAEGKVLLNKRKLVSPVFKEWVTVCKSYSDCEFGVNTGTGTDLFIEMLNKYQ